VGIFLKKSTPKIYGNTINVFVFGTAFSIILLHDVFFFIYRRDCVIDFKKIKCDYLLFRLLCATSILSSVIATRYYINFYFD
jgi:hypothetical protein